MHRRRPLHCRRLRLNCAAGGCGSTALRFYKRFNVSLKTRCVALITWKWWARQTSKKQVLQNCHSARHTHTHTHTHDWLSSKHSETSLSRQSTTPNWTHSQQVSFLSATLNCSMTYVRAYILRDTLAYSCCLQTFLSGLTFQSVSSTWHW